MLERARKGMAALGKSPSVLPMGALRVRAGCLKHDPSQWSSAMCNRALGRISRGLLEDFWGFILVHLSRTWW